jgi:hypothetical protein
MASDVFSFLWSVPESGYQWVQARAFVNEGGAPPNQLRPDSRANAALGWALTDGLAIGQRYVVRQYSPLKMFTGLYRTFAELPFEDRGALLAFANEYGDLGIRRPLSLTGRDEPPHFRGVRGDLHEDWVREIDAMRRAVAIWDMVDRRDAAGVARFVRWEEAEYAEDGRTETKAAGWFYDSHPDLPSPQVDLRKGAPTHPGRFIQMITPVLDLFKPGDVLAPASFLVQRWINEHLKGKAAPCLVYHLDLGKRALQIIPNNLLSAMWLQFAQAIAANKGYADYRACRECGKWFELSHKQADHRTVRRQFCSDPCKSRDYRRRKERAQQLKAEGKPLKDIAKELDTDAETIKKWVGKRKG